MLIKIYQMVSQLLCYNSEVSFDFIGFQRWVIVFNCSVGLFERNHSSQTRKKFTLKYHYTSTRRGNTSNVFRPQCRKNLKTQQSPIILHLCLRELSLGNHMIIETPSISKSSVLKMFSVHTETKSRRFKFLRFEERFRKAPFS